MASEFENQIGYFLNNVLFTPAGSLPKGAQWVVVYHDLNAVFPAIKLAAERENTGWMIEDAASVIMGETYQKNKGCVLCQAIDIPGETLVVNPEGNIQSNAYLRSYVGQGRTAYPEMRMTFLETNVSFADNFLRPWALATANFGMIARNVNEEKNYRTHIYCYKLGSYSHEDKGPKILMQVSFYDACCIHVSNEEYNYSAVTNPVLREATFVYNYYSINTNLDQTFQQSINPNLNSITTRKNKVSVTNAFENKVLQNDPPPKRTQSNGKGTLDDVTNKAIGQWKKEKEDQRVESFTNMEKVFFKQLNKNKNTTQSNEKNAVNDRLKEAINQWKKERANQRTSL